MKVSFPWKKDGDTVTELLTGREYKAADAVTIQIDPYGYMVFK